MNITQDELRQLDTHYLSRAVPLPLTAMPDGTTSATVSPAWYTEYGAAMVWRSADATQNFARVSFRIPAGNGTRTLLVRGLLRGTATAESTIIKSYWTGVAAGDTVAWAVTNSTQQSAVSVSTALVEVTIAAIVPSRADHTVLLAFRPRSATDTNVAQNKILEALWLA